MMATAPGMMVLGSMEVLKGFLIVQRPSTRKSSDRQWCILYHGQKDLSPRIDIHENDPRLTGAPCTKTVYIESAKWKKVNTLEPAFSIKVKHGKQWVFYCSNTAQRRDWVLTLCCVSGELFGSKDVVGISDEGTISASANPEDEYAVGKVYDGAPGEQVFMALADHADGCAKFGWTGVYKLSIGNGKVRLLDFTSDAQVVQWALTEIREYGGSKEIVFLLSGRRSSTKEGRFAFRTTQATKIIDALARETRLFLQELSPPDYVAPTPMTAPSDTTAAVVGTNPVEEGVEYSVVSRLQSGSSSSAKRSNSYENDSHLFPNNDAPPTILPPHWEQDADNGSNTNNKYYKTTTISNTGCDGDAPVGVYASTKQLPSTQYGHVYGLGSASQQFSPTPAARTTSSYVNVYDGVDT